MKIMFLIGDLRKGGAERVIANLSNYLCDNNEVMILMTKTDRIEYYIDEKVKKIGIDDSKLVKNNVLVRNIKRIQKMKKIIFEKEPDIIISFLKEPTNRILILKKFYKRIRRIPLMISIRNDPKIVFKTMIDKILLKTLYKLPEGYVFQTNEAKEYFNKKIQDKSKVIPNPINPDFVCERYKGKKENIIVSVGKLMKQKNQKLLIEAFRDINEKYEGYKLFIYGEGELRSELTSLIEQYNLTNKVFLKGNVENIKDEIYKAKMFIMTSDYEGMPNALMEAMALGLPCISTDCPCGGPKFLIENEQNGLLFEVGNKIELEEKMTMIIEDQYFAEKLGSNASKISEKLSPDIINRNWENYIYSFKH